jgi:hypothetical protein
MVKPKTKNTKEILLITIITIILISLYLINNNQRFVPTKTSTVIAYGMDMKPILPSSSRSGASYNAAYIALNFSGTNNGTLQANLSISGVTPGLFSNSSRLINPNQSTSWYSIIIPTTSIQGNDKLFLANMVGSWGGSPYSNQNKTIGTYLDVGNCQIKFRTDAIDGDYSSACVIEVDYYGNGVLEPFYRALNGVAPTTTPSGTLLPIRTPQNGTMYSYFYSGTYLIVQNKADNQYYKYMYYGPMTGSPPTVNPECVSVMSNIKLGTNPISEFNTCPGQPICKEVGICQVVENDLVGSIPPAVNTNCRVRFRTSHYPNNFYQTGDVIGLDFNNDGILEKFQYAGTTYSGTPEGLILGFNTSVEGHYISFVHSPTSYVVIYDDGGYGWKFGRDESVTLPTTNAPTEPYTSQNCNMFPCEEYVQCNGRQVGIDCPVSKTSTTIGNYTNSGMWLAMDLDINGSYETYGLYQDVYSSTKSAPDGYLADGTEYYIDGNTLTVYIGQVSANSYHYTSWIKGRGPAAGVNVVC